MAVLLLLCACHADLDWRELRSEEGRFSAWFPARAFEESRPLSGRNQGILMRQWSARALDTVFAVGYADFTRLETRTVDEIRDALLANISARVLSEKAISVGSAHGREIFAAGQAGGAQLSLRLRLIARQSRLYQVAVLGKPGNVPESEIDTFFESFRLLKAPD